MTKHTQLLLIISIITSIVGSLSKINGYKTVGDIFLGIGTITFLYLLFKFVNRLINK